MSTLSPGSTLTHYRIIELIARGGMGEVYKAVDTKLGRTVAIKIPGESIIEDTKARRRFLHEAHAASRLSHPNICTIFEVGEDSDRPFIVMEYIDGPTLQHMIAGAPLEIEPALRFAVQIADAIEEAHRCGIIHRDLKPSNIIINPRGMAVILDFGLAKRLRDNESKDEDAPTIMQSLTTGATIVGTVAYMSPEQVRAGSLDARSDIFAYGILLYEMLAGRRPFQGQGQVEIMHAILHDSPRPLSELRPDVDPEIERIATKAMEKNPDSRFQGFGELKRELWAVVRARGYDLSGAITGATTLPARTDLATREVTSPGRWPGGGANRTIQIVVGMAILLAGAWLIWFLSRRGERGTGALESRTLVSWKSDLGDIVSTRARFSRDGRLLVYDATQGGHTDLWIKQISGADPVPVPGTQDAWADTSPVFSPDGEQIAFLSNRGGQHGIWSVPTLGGTPQLLTALDRGSSDLLSWSRDGRTIYYNFNFNLFALDLPSGERRQMVSFPNAPRLDRKFSLSPDEKQIVYFDIQNGQQDIWTRPLDGGAARRITNDAAPDWNPLWHPDGERIVYTSTRGGVTQIFVVGIAGETPRQITFNDADSGICDISADGTRILYAMSRDESDLWSVQTETAVATPVTTDVGVELWPDATAVGAKIAYQANRMQSIGADLFSGAIFTRDLRSGGRALQLASGGFAPQWSPDGERLAFLKRENEQNSIWVVRNVGGDPVRVTEPGVLFGGFSRLPYNRLQPRDFSWSPDGRQIAYSASRRGRSTIWTTEIGGTGEREATRNDEPAVIYFSPVWSPNGRALAWLARSGSSDGSAKWSIRVQEGEATQTVYETERALRLLGWSPDGRELLIKNVDGVRDTISTPVTVTLVRVPAAGGEARTIARIEAAYFHNIHLSTDGRWIASVVRPERVDQIDVIDARGGSARRIVRGDEPLNYLANLAWAPDGKTIYYSKQTNTRAITMIDRFQ